MIPDELLQNIYPKIGGKENVSREVTRGNVLYLTVKDIGAVDLEAVRQMEGVAVAELSRGRLTVRLEGDKEENSMAKNYDELADRILDLVGGKENISFFTHCVTRLRFNVNDKSKVDVDAIKKIKGVVGAQWSGDQLQIIIGQSVADAYELICKKTGLAQQKQVNENLDTTKKKKFSAAAILDGLTGSLVPLMPALIGGGLIKLIVLLLTMAGVLNSEMPTYTVLTFVGDAVFYFLPVMVGASTAKKFGGNVTLGILIGAIFIHPTFINAVSEGTKLSIFGLPIYGASYASTVFPALLSVYFMCKVEKVVSKYSPAALRSMLEPFLTILITVPFALCLFGPIGSILGDYLAIGIMWLYNTVGFVGCAVFAGLYPLLVMTGMHTGMTPYYIQSFVTLGYEPIGITTNIVNNINQGAACVAVALKSHSKDVKSEAVAAASTAVFGGVSEPALFGISLRFKKPLIGVMLGNFVAAGYAGLMKVVAYPSGNCTIFGIVRYISEDKSNLVNMIIAMVIGAVISFLFTFFTFKGTEETAVEKK